MGNRKATDLSSGFVVNNRYRVVEKLGGGAAGTVYRVVQLGLNVDRAMKVLSPKWYGIDENLFKEFQSTFEQEIRLFSSVTHRNVTKIIDAGTLVIGGGKSSTTPYYVMELISPPLLGAKPASFTDVLRSAPTKTALLALIFQILDGLEYLHSYGILHADIKPENVLCHEARQGDVEIKLGDLGVSKALWNPSGTNRLPGLSDLALSTMTKVYGSIKYAPAYARKLIDSGQAVPREELRRYLPHLDLYCLGVTLAEAISDIPLDKRDRNIPAMLHSVRPQVAALFDAKADVDVLVRIISRLTTDEPHDSVAYSSVSSVREDFRKLKDEYLQPLGLPELAVGGLQRSVSLTTGKIMLSRRMHALLNHPLFQRLHQYKQLNLVYHVFPEAHHSRLTHALNVYRIALLYARALLGDPHFRHLMNARDYSLLCAAALLHDIGHYPLTHALDDLAVAYRDHQEQGELKYPRRQEELIGQLLNLAPASGVGSLRSALEADAWDVDCDSLMRVVSKGTPVSDSESIIQSIIDGPIDADKCAYLQQDSATSGVAYGLGVDLDGFLAGLVVVPSSTGRRAQIGVTEKGITAAESIIHARSDMYARVYWHHTNRAIMAMIKHTAETVFGGPGGYTFERYLSDTLFMSDVEALRLLAARYRECFGAEKDVDVPAERLFDGNRSIYRRIVSVSAEDPRENGPRIYRTLTTSSPEAIERIRNEMVDLIAKRLGRSLREETAVLVDIPRIDPEGDTLKTVFVDVPSHPARYVELKLVSAVVGALHNNFQARVKKCRFYVPPEIRDELREKGLIEGVERDLRSLLSERAR